MDAGYISAMAALAGSAIGALTSLTTSWLTQHAQARATLRVQDRARREALYGEFIREASKLFVDAFEHELDDPAKLLQLYAIVSTIRLFGQPRTDRGGGAGDDPDRRRLLRAEQGAAPVRRHHQGRRAGPAASLSASLPRGARNWRGPSGNLSPRGVGPGTGCPESGYRSRARRP